ncbi:hypothetical protein NCC49_005044 [Naganishia albida]|nr:hypothetical protein NCC49_005044 [Naganishia albida]
MASEQPSMPAEESGPKDEANEPIKLSKKDKRKKTNKGQRAEEKQSARKKGTKAYVEDEAEDDDEEDSEAGEECLGDGEKEEEEWHPVKPHPKINKDRAFEQLKMVMKHHPAFEPDSIQDRLKRLTGMLHDCTRRTPWSKLLWQVSRSE